MNPSKKIHTQTPQNPLSTLQTQFDEDGQSVGRSEEVSSATSKKQRKRRTLSETSKRDFICGCGKSYVSYPAIYLHVQRKHGGEWPPNTLIPEKPESQDKVKRGRPKKEKNNMLDVNNDPQEELKYKVEDNFWLFMGLKGNSDNQKVENRFISNLESHSYDPYKMFNPEEIFNDPLIHLGLSSLFKELENHNQFLNSGKASRESALKCDHQLAGFIHWISNPLKEEIFVEVCIILIFLRIIIFSCIWYDQNKEKVVLQNETLHISLSEKAFMVNLTKPEILNIKSFQENNVCPFLGAKWIELKKTKDGELIKEIIDKIEKCQSTDLINKLFYEKLRIFSDISNNSLNKIVEATLYLKETELKESIKSSQNFYFLSWRSNEDLKEFIQKLCDWLQYFNEEELKLHQINFEDKNQQFLPSFHLWLSLWQSYYQYKKCCLKIIILSQKELKLKSLLKNQNMATKLRDLIRNVRSCKTAAEERALISKEKAAIRTSFTESEEEYRARNIAKLLFIGMLGHDTDFGQIECLKLITSSNYADKKIGYLGLTQLFNEKSEVLMMSTHRIRSDLQSTTHYVVAIALCSLSEIATADMCKELAPEVCKLMVSGNNYIKKKAALSATRILRRVPELCDEFIDKVPRLMEERHHGVLLSTISLVIDILQTQETQKDKFKKYVPFLVKVLKNLVSSYSAEFDISGIIDPFLQIEILKFFRMMAEGDESISEEINDILTQVATNTPGNKNTGNAVLFECVKTIMAIESSNTLKTLAINILGKFLQSKESNSKNLRYVGLQSLQKVVKFDMASVQKHKSTILECLRENDMSIKKLALDVLYLITNEKNIESIVKEMLNYILVSEPEFLQDLTLKICSSVEKYSPDRRWHVDTIIKVLTLAGNYVQDESLYSLLHLISATPQLQTYAVHKIFFSLRENISQEGLAKAGLWCIGEFGNLLISGKATASDNTPIHVSEDEVLTLIQKIMTRFNVSELVKEYALNSLIKLYAKFSKTKDRIRALIDSQTTSPHLEVQQRACEYLQLLEGDWDAIRGAILESIPLCQNATTDFSNKPLGDTTIWEIPPQSNEKREEGVSPIAQNTVYNPLDDDLLGGGSSTSTEQPQKSTENLFEILGGGNSGQSTSEAKKDINIMELFGTGLPQSTSGIGSGISPLNPNPVNSMFNLLGAPVTVNPAQTNIGGMSGFSLLDPSIGVSTAQSSSNNLTLKALEDSNIEIIFNCSKENFDTANVTTLFNNKSSSQITNLVFQVAVQKHCKLTMNPISSSAVPALSTGAVTQSMKINNSQQGKKAIAMKIKVLYDMGGSNYSQEAVVSNFPVTF